MHLKKIRGYSSPNSQRLQECAKIRVNECEYAKKCFAIFSDVCFFFFWTASIFADFCLFCVLSPSLGVTLGAPNQRYLYWLSDTYICR